MNWSDSTLTAFADGELDAGQSNQLEAALTNDDALLQRLEAITRQRDRLAAAFAPVLDEPIPDRLSALLRELSVASANITDLGAARAEKELLAGLQEQPVPAPRKAFSSWAQWGGMAASVVLGVVMGTQLKPSAGNGDMGLQDGKLVAGGAIEKSLATQLASDNRSGGPVNVQLSFVDKRGQYCRTFSTGQIAGLACQDGRQWAVQHLATVDATPDTALRQAGSALPQSVLDAVDQRIAGDALNADAERAARAQGWKH